MLSAYRFITACLLWLLASAAAGQPIAPEEIIVTGRQPGPPMWKVSRGDHELWIFAYLGTIPKDMLWESDKVAARIARSQEYIGMPNTTIGTSPLLLFNPLNLVRGYRLIKRLSRNPDGALLSDVLPADLYARFRALKAGYFPDDDEIGKLRPLTAGGRMISIIEQEAGLVNGGDVMKRINRLARRNRGMHRTDIEAEMVVEGSYRSLADRAENVMDGMEPAQELACFESQLKRMESDLDEMKIRANSWAQGYVDEFRGIPAPRELHAACENLIMASSEAGMVQDLQAEANGKWLTAAELALANNVSTFAVLDIYELLSSDGLLAQLQARGYDIRVP